MPPNLAKRHAYNPTFQKKYFEPLSPPPPEIKS